MCLAQNLQAKWHCCHHLSVWKTPCRMSMRKNNESFLFPHHLDPVKSSWLHLLNKHVHTHTNVGAVTHAFSHENMHKCIMHLTPPVQVSKSNDGSVTNECRVQSPVWPYWNLGLAFSLQLDVVILDICQKEQQPNTYFTLHKSLCDCQNDFLAECPGLWWL